MHNDDAEACIAMALTCLASAADHRQLELMFGPTLTQRSTDVDDGTHCLLRALQACPAATIEWSIVEQQSMLNELSTIAYGEPPLCVRIVRWQTGHDDEPRRSGRTTHVLQWPAKTTGILSQLTFKPDGCFIHATVNLAN